MTTPSKRALQYAESVRKGADVPHTIKAAVDKWFLYREAYGFDSAQVDLRGRLAEMFYLPEGDHEKLVLMPWQCWVMSWLYGFWMENGLRAVSNALLLVPRKAGKTTLASSMLLGELVLSSNTKRSPRLIIAGETDDVADMGYDKITSILLHDEREHGGFCEEFGVELRKHEVYSRNCNGKLRKLTLGGKNLEGFTPSCIYVDEISRMPTNHKLETLRSGFGHNPNYLIFMTTTYSDLPTSALEKEREKVLMWLEDKENLGRYVGMLWEARLSDNSYDKKVWRRTQPAWKERLPGIEVYYEEMAVASMTDAEAKYSFDARQICKPVHGGTAWISLESLMELDGLEGAPIPLGKEWLHTIGCDFSDTLATTSLCLLSTNTKTMEHQARFKIFYCSGAGVVKETGEEDMVLIQSQMHKMYQEYGQQGHVTVVDGPAISHRVVAEHIQMWDNHVSGARMILTDNYDAYEEVREYLEPRTKQKLHRAPKGPNTTTAAAHLLKVAVGDKRLKMDQNPVVLQHFKNTRAILTAQGGLKLEAPAPGSPYKIDAVDSIVHAFLARDMCRQDKHYGTAINPVDNRVSAKPKTGWVLDQG